MLDSLAARNTNGLRRRGNALGPLEAIDHKPLDLWWHKGQLFPFIELVAEPEASERVLP